MHSVLNGSSTAAALRNFRPFPTLRLFDRCDERSLKMPETIFSKIIRREVPADIVHEDDLCLAFHDISPQAPVHVLVIPKEPIESLAALRSEHEALAGHLVLVATKIARELNLDTGYRLVCNNGDDGGQAVAHLHFHLLGGRSFSWPPG